MSLDPLQQRVEDIVERFVSGYQRQKERAAQLLAEVESESARKELARTDPTLARAFERRTTEEREQAMEEACIGLGVAHAIMYALGETS